MDAGKLGKVYWNTDAETGDMLAYSIDTGDLKGAIKRAASGTGYVWFRLTDNRQSRYPYLSMRAVREAIEIEEGVSR